MNHPARRKARAAGRIIQLARKRNAEGQGRVTESAMLNSIVAPPSGT